MYYVCIDQIGGLCFTFLYYNIVNTGNGLQGSDSDVTMQMVSKTIQQFVFKQHFSLMFQLPLMSLYKRHNFNSEVNIDIFVQKYEFAYLSHNAGCLGTNSVKLSH